MGRPVMAIDAIHLPLKHFLPTMVARISFIKNNLCSVKFGQGDLLNLLPLPIAVGVGYSIIL